MILFLKDSVSKRRGKPRSTALLFITIIFTYGLPCRIPSVTATFANNHANGRNILPVGRSHRIPPAPFSQLSVLKQRHAKRSYNTSLRLGAETPPDTTTKSAKVRFSSSSSAGSKENLIDAAFSWITSDIGSIVLGGTGLVLLLVGRLILDANVLDETSSSVEASNAIAIQTRVNLLAVFAIGAVLLNGLSQLDVQSALAEQVELEGTRIEDPIISTSSVDAETLQWVLSSIVAATPADTAILLFSENGNWQPKAFTGIVPSNLLKNDVELAERTPILDRFLKLPSSDESQRQESYLPTLQVLPGKKEFTDILLPSNTQAALLIPLKLLAGQTTLLLGSNQARSFTPRDIAWCQRVASRLEE